MAVYHVAADGSDTATGSATAPLKTIAKANTKATRGDTITVLDSTSYRGQISCKTGVTYQSLVKRGAKIDCQGLDTYAFVGAGMNQTTTEDVVIDGFTIFDAKGAGISGKFAGITIKNCDIFDTPGNGISINGASDLVDINGNDVHHCAHTSSANSGISVLLLQTFKDADGVALPNLSGGWGAKVRNNRVWGCGRMDHDDSDGNGIIFDKFHWTTTAGKRYTRTSLIEYNTVWGNAGAGIKTMSCQDVTIRFNTSYGNAKWPADSDGTWAAAYLLMYSSNIVFTDNIGVNTEKYAWCLVNAYRSAAYPSNQPLRGNNHTYARNLFYNSHANGNMVKADKASDGAQLITSSEYINANPLFNAPGSGDFSLKTGSPALGAGAGGKNIGAWQGGTPPPPDPVTTTVNKAPVVNFTKAESGEAYTVVAGTYNGTAVVSARKAQLKVAGKWTEVTSAAFGVFPVVTEETDFAVKEDWTGTGVTTNQVNRSLVIKLRPAAIDPPDPDDPITLASLKSLYDALRIDFGLLVTRVGELELYTDGIVERVDGVDDIIGDMDLAMDGLTNTTDNLVGRMDDAEKAIEDLKDGIEEPGDGSGPMPETQGPAYLLTNGSIDCAVKHPTLGWVRFLARSTDPMDYGRDLHAYWNARTGELIAGNPPA